MRRRLRNVMATPRLLLEMLKTAAAPFRSTAFLAAGFGGAVLLLVWLLFLSMKAYLPRQAEQAFVSGEYAAAAEAYLSFGGERSRFNAANAHYRAGEYAKALGLYEEIRSGDPRFKAAVYFNAGNSLTRLKAYAKAREMFRKSLVLQADPEAVENLLCLTGAETQDQELGGRREGKEMREEEKASSQQGNRKRKEGGGSDRPMQAEHSRGGGAQGKEVRREAQLDFSGKGKSPLSSKQYDLINQRSVDETRPW